MGERANDDATAEPSHPRLVAIRPGALGDALLTFPVLSWLRHHVPSVRIALVARRDVLLLAQSSGVADDVSPYEDPAWSVLFADEPASRGLAYQICSGARVVAWFGADDGVVRRNLLALGASAVVVAPGKPVQSCQRHMALQLGEGLAQLGYPAPATVEELVEVSPPVRPSDECRDRILSWLSAHDIEARRLVAVHPGSGGDAKRWPAESFAALLASLAADGYSPMLIEGPQDTGVVREILSSLSLLAGSVPIARDLPVERLAALLGRCAAYVGNDSGVTHLAALAGCPTVAIFGPTDDALWRPLGRRVLLARAATGRVADVPVDSVAALVRDLLAGE